LIDDCHEPLPPDYVLWPGPAPSLFDVELDHHSHVHSANYKQANSQNFSTIVPSTKWDEYKQADQAFKVNIVALVSRLRKKKMISLLPSPS
jgi:hypothetical protein